MRKTSKTEYSLDHRIVVVVVAIAEPSKPEQEMDDQPERDYMVAEDVGHLDVGEASVQSPLQVEARQQGLDDDQSPEGSQPLVFETNLGNLVERAVDICFTNLH
jgi:hypothetical protein